MHFIVFNNKKYFVTQYTCTRCPYTVPVYVILINHVCIGFLDKRDTFIDILRIISTSSIHLNTALVFKRYIMKSLMYFTKRYTIIISVVWISPFKFVDDSQCQMKMVAFESNVGVTFFRVLQKNHFDSHGQSYSENLKAIRFKNFQKDD